MSARRDARILVVEDNDTLRGGVALALRESWSDVEEAASGEEALARSPTSAASPSTSS